MVTRDPGRLQVARRRACGGAPGAELIGRLGEICV
jgi:hypothetical protein